MSVTASCGNTAPHGRHVWARAIRDAETFLDNIECAGVPEDGRLGTRTAEAIRQYTPRAHEIRARAIAGGALVVGGRSPRVDGRSSREAIAGEEYDRWPIQHDQGVRAATVRDARQGIIDSQLGSYGIVLPDVAEVVDYLDARADLIEQGAL